MSATMKCLAVMVVAAALGMTTPCRAFCPSVSVTKDPGAEMLFVVGADNMLELPIRQADLDVLDLPVGDVARASALRHLLRTRVSEAGQQWMRSARPFAKLEVANGFDGGFFFDGVSSVAVEECFPIGTGGQAFSWGGGECDIRLRFPTAENNCTDEWRLFGFTRNATGDDGNDFDRLLVHEMGHCLGLAHPSSELETVLNVFIDPLTQCTDPNGIVPADTCFTTGPHGCAFGQSMCGGACPQAQDGPTADDVSGVVATSRSPGERQLTRPVSLAVAGWDQATARLEEPATGTGWVLTDLPATYPPRIDCGGSIHVPDCVLARTSNGRVFVDRLFFSEPGSAELAGVGTSEIAIGSFRSPDVAMAVEVNRIVAAFSWVLPPGIALHEHPGEDVEHEERVEAVDGSIRVLVLDRRDPITFGPGASLSFTNSAGDLVAAQTPFGPRVTYFAGSADGSVEGYFLVAFVDRSRRLRLFRSADELGNPPYVQLPSLDPPGSGIDGVPFGGEFDIHCPQHTENAAQRERCTVLLKSNAAAGAFGELGTCELRLQANGYSSRDNDQQPLCRTSEVAAAAVGTLTDGPDPSEAPAWISTRSNHFQGEVPPSPPEFLAHAVSLQRPLILDDDPSGTGTPKLDAQICLSVREGTQRPQTLLGGVGVGFCEFCERYVIAGMGHVSEGDEVGLCF